MMPPGDPSLQAKNDPPTTGRRLTDGAAMPVLVDLCSTGNALRVLIPLNLGAVLCAFLDAGSLRDQALFLLHLVVVIEPLALLSVLALCAFRSRINGLPIQMQWVFALGLPVSIAIPILSLDLWLNGSSQSVLQFMLTLSIRLLAVGIVTWATVRVLQLRAIALAPSFSEARLQALQARIRPHFLFNSLNNVLGLIRTEPRRAEFMLENLADLFRVLMRDTRDLVAIEEEVVTCQQYLSIEADRLGDRLRVQWDLDSMVPDALIPSLLLQPLLENAIHHGIEPGIEPGLIRIVISQQAEQVHVEIENTLVAGATARPGNQMGLSNVRERLTLLYDTAVRFEAGPEGKMFRVAFDFPYKKERRRYVRRTFNPDH
jgi:two-component system sensor histidine kinase AlgZ